MYFLQSVKGTLSVRSKRLHVYSVLSLGDLNESGVFCKML